MVKKVTLENYDSLNDLLFFKYMLEKGNEKQLKTFLEAIGVEIKGKFKVTNPTLPPDRLSDKKCILDCLCETNDTLINIELQQKETTDFIERMMFYMAKNAKLIKGKEYTEFKNVILIIIANFNINDFPKYKQEFLLINSESLKHIISGKFKIILIELEKFQEVIKDLNDKEHLYLTFFVKNTDHKRRKELGEMDEGLKAAVKKIEEALQDDEALRIYHKLEYEKMLKENEEIRLKKSKEKGKEEGLEEGMEKGRDEGLEEKAIEVATNLKNMGLSVQDIARATNLSKEFIETL
jgi:predicted transposase/invertase (TIGR01784 family)